MFNRYKSEQTYKHLLLWYLVTSTRKEVIYRGNTYITLLKKQAIDNMIMMRAVIDNNRRLNRKAYCYFADAYKCFDNLWLKDCVVELWRAGMRREEVYMLYEMNKKITHCDRNTGRK